MPFVYHVRTHTDRYVHVYVHALSARAICSSVTREIRHDVETYQHRVEAAGRDGFIEARTGSAADRAVASRALPVQRGLESRVDGRFRAARVESSRYGQLHRRPVRPRALGLCHCHGCSENLWVYGCNYHTWYTSLTSYTEGLQQVLPIEDAPSIRMGALFALHHFWECYAEKAVTLVNSTINLKLCYTCFGPTRFPPRSFLISIFTHSASCRVDEKRKTHWHKLLLELSLTPRGGGSARGWRVEHFLPREYRGIT